VGAGVGGLAVVGYLARRVRVRPPRLAGLALAVVVVNLAFMAGWWNLVRGRRIEAWHGTAWDANTSPRG
jgi:hypothetical protein